MSSKEPSTYSQNAPAKIRRSLQVIKETSKVVLHTASLELGSASLQSDALQSVQDAQTREFDEKNERGIFSFNTALPAGSKARFSIPFKGALTGDMLGYYRSTGGKDGELKYTLTQFEVMLCVAHGVSPQIADSIRS